MPVNLSRKAFGQEFTRGEIFETVPITLTLLIFPKKTCSFGPEAQVFMKPEGKECLAANVTAEVRGPPRRLQPVVVMTHLDTSRIPASTVAPIRL